jgi:hypothetical protein
MHMGSAGKLILDGFVWPNVQGNRPARLFVQVRMTAGLGILWQPIDGLIACSRNAIQLSFGTHRLDVFE